MFLVSLEHLTKTFSDNFLNNPDDGPTNQPRQKHKTPNPGIPNPEITAHILNPESRDWQSFNPGILGL